MSSKGLTLLFDRWQFDDHPTALFVGLVVEDVARAAMTVRLSLKDSVLVINFGSLVISAANIRKIYGNAVIKSENFI